MKHLILAFALLALQASANPPLEPGCGFAWDRVDDARVVGYRLYLDGMPATEILQGTYTADCAALNLTNGPHSIYATAYSNNQESDPSNVINFEYDGSELSPPNFRLELNITMGVTVGGESVVAGEDVIQVGH